MRASLLPLLLLIASALGCERAPPDGPTRAEHEAVLQRLDAMERRLDPLEDALTSIPAAPAPLPRGPVVVTLPPAAKAEDPAALDPLLRMQVRADGLYLEGRPVSSAQAKARFEAAASTEPRPRLVVLTEPEVPHARTMEVLDMARAAGLEELALSARVHGSEAR